MSPAAPPSEPAPLPRARSAADRIDALLWLLVPAFVLFVVPIGFASNEGLGHSRTFAGGYWVLNPNHLLFEPLGAWWQGVWARSGSSRLPVDVLKLLSALAGALAAALFRWGVAAPLARSRSAANLATAWLALSSAFLRLWVSDEIHMIQMPFVVAVFWLGLRWFARPAPGRALALGAAVGLAGLAFISNLLLGVTIAVVFAGWELLHRRPRRALGAAAAVVLGVALVALPALLLAGRAAAGDPPFLAWLTHGRFGAGPVPLARSERAYGAPASGQGVIAAVPRALYGAAEALVDLTPLGAAVRDRQAPAIAAVLGALAFLAAGASLLHALWTIAARPSRAPERAAPLLALAFFAAVLGFGVFWDNSDDQFYFQLAPAFGAIAAAGFGWRGRTAAIFTTLGIAALLWNVFDVSSRRILYPRQARMVLLEKEARGACLVVHPGFDEVEVLLTLAGRREGTERQTITNLAVRMPAEEGIRVLRDRVESCLAAGGRVVLIDLVDQPPERNPWKFLRRLGYDQATIAGALEPYLPAAPASRRVGPFTVVSFAPRLPVVPVEGARLQ